MANLQSHSKNHEQMAEHAKDIKEQAVDQAKDVKDQVAQKAHKVAEKASEAYENVKDTLCEAGYNIQEQSEHLYDVMAKYVRENPLKAIGIAALSGSILAIVLSKMKD